MHLIGMTQNITFETALSAFVVAAQEKVNDSYKNYTNLTPPTLTTEFGSKNVKVVVNGQNQRSVFCFVRREDGAVLKAAGWKAPAKHVRGSIYVNNGRDAVTAYGANYLR